MGIKGNEANVLRRVHEEDMQTEWRMSQRISEQNTIINELKKENADLRKQLRELGMEA